jgi:hypothetical protein
MTPKEKAFQLVDKFDRGGLWGKEHALNVVDEILKAYPHTYDKEIAYTSNGDEITIITNVRCNNEFWYEVKKEIEKYEQ